MRAARPRSTHRFYGVMEKLVNARDGRDGMQKKKSGVVPRISPSRGELVGVLAALHEAPMGIVIAKANPSDAEDDFGWIGCWTAANDVHLVGTASRADSL